MDPPPNKPSDLTALSFDEYAEEYIRSRTSIKRGADFLRGLFTRPPPLFEGLMPERTVTMISAEPGCGKTLLALSMCLSIDQGVPLLGKYPAARRRRAFFLGQDAPSWDYAEQLRKLVRGAKLPNTTDLEIDFLLNSGGDFTERGFLAMLQEWHEQTSYELIVFDTLASFHDMDENNVRQMGAIMAILKKLRDQFRCSVVFTHHTRKPGEVPMSGNYSARGSGVISGSVDFHFSLHRRGENQVLMSLAKGRGGEKLVKGSGFTIEEADTPDGPEVKLSFHNTIR